MGAAAPSYPPPPVLRAAALPITSDHVHRVRSESKRQARKRSRELLASAIRTERATMLDVADALEVNERRVRAAIEISEDAGCIDIGDPLAMAKTGPGGLRLARRIYAELIRELDAIEFASGHR